MNSNKENIFTQDTFVKNSLESRNVSVKIPLKQVFFSPKKKNSKYSKACNYSMDIFFNLSQCVEPFYCDPYFSKVLSINLSVGRDFLIHWVIELHEKLRLLPETLYVCIGIIDRYLLKKPVEKKSLQILGLGSILIATKYEEIYPPTIKDILTVSEYISTKQNLLKMEIEILRTLDFQITFPSSLFFLQKFSEFIDNNNCEFIKYLLELGQSHYYMVKYQAQVQAAAAVYLGNLIINNIYPWKEENCIIKECIEEFFKIAKCASSSPLNSIRNKYLKKNLNIETIENNIF